MTDGISITIGASVASAIIGGVMTYWRAKSTQRTESRITPQPLEVRQPERYVRCEDCADHRRRYEASQLELFGRMKTVEGMASSTNGKLDLIASDLSQIKALLMGGIKK